MNKGISSTKRKLFALIVAVMLFSVCLFGLNVSRKALSAANGENAVYSQTNGKTYALETQTEFSSLACGTYFAMPESVKIVVSESEKIDATDERLTFPSGIVYGKGTYLLNEVGEYKITYYADYKGETVSAEEKFFVTDKKWSVSSAKSSATFGNLTGYGATVKKDGQDVSWAEGKKGIRVSLAEGDVFRYNVPTDVYKIGSGIDLFKIYPDVRETAQTDKNLQYTNTVNCYYVTVRLVDVYDENNYVEFLLWGDKIAFYNSAGWSGQSPVGLEPCTCSGVCKNAKKVEYEGDIYHKHAISRYEKSGQYGVNSRAWTSKELVLKGGFNAQWDTNTNKVYSKVEGVPKLITDLDDSALHGDNIFRGFSTGEVFVEIQPQSYSGGKNIEIEIEELLGLSGDDLADAVYYDTTAPVVEINAEKTDDAGVYASKGVEVTVPDCTVHDINYNGDLKANVYYNYGTSEQVVVYLKDGKFTPKQSGIYTLVYRATDSFGNKGYATLRYNVIDKKPFDYTENKLDEIIPGAKNALPILSVRGNNIQPVVTMSVIDPKGNESVVTGGEFLADYLGEYTVRYEIKDNVYTLYYEYKVNANTESEAYFYDEPILPRYFIKGATYDIYALNAYTITSDGRQPHLSSVYVAADGGAFEKLTEKEKAEYTVTANSSVRFEYRYENATKLSEKITVLDVGYTEENKDYGGFFAGDYSQQIKQSNQIDFLFDGLKTSGNIEFASPLLFNGFDFTFVVPKTNADYSSISVQICDYANLKTTNTIVYRKTTQGVTVSVNGSKDQTLKDVFADTYSIVVKGDKIEIDNTKSFALKEFESRLCLLKITVEGIDGESVISLKELNGNKLRENTKEANLTIDFDYPAGVYKRGTSYTTSKAIVNGAFSICLESSVKITVTIDGKVVSDINGKPINKLAAAEEYTFNLETSGIYKIEYEAKVGNKEVGEQAIFNVVDTVAPTITFEEGLNETKYVKVKVGAEYNFASFTVSDNLTPTEDLIVDVYVRDVNFNTIQVGGTSTAFTYRGYYIIQVYCMDTDGNYATAYYYVLAE